MRPHQNVGRRAAVALIAGSLALLGLAAAGAGNVRASGDPYSNLTGNVTLINDQLGGLNFLTPTGAVDPAQTMQIGVSLHRPDAAGEDAYIQDVYNPTSPNFRQFLDPAGFAQRFGVSQTRYDQLIAWLSNAGFTTTPVAGSTEYVLATGSAGNVESLFQTPINNYHVNTTSFFANTMAPTVPANLGIISVAGLQNLAHFFTDKQLYAMSNAGKTQTGVPQSPAAPQHTGSTTPQDLWHIYQQPSNNRGAGESMAIFGWGCTEPGSNPECAGIDVTGNLRSFETTYSLPQIPIQITNYGSGTFDNNGTGEWTLDLPASTGMAPDAALEHLYFGVNGQDPDMLAAFTGWNTDGNGPRQGSASFAGCEASPLTGSQPGGPGNPPGTVIIGNPNQDAYESELKVVVMLGRTLFNSSGDLGPNGCPLVSLVLNGVTPTPVQLNDYPSVSQWVTTVGGTVLYWNGLGDTGPTPATRYLEYSWTFTGGGTSDFVSAAPWQQALSFHTQTQSAPGVTQPCASDWHNPPNAYAAGTWCRGMPDVAAQSGDVVTNGYVAGGGTSLSSPLWLGMWTRIQAASSNPGRLGFASAAIYANNADATKWANDFFDIGSATSPSNADGGPTTAPTCSGLTAINSCSKPGWDYLSGWGTPKVTNLMKDLNNGNTAPTPFVPNNIPETPLVFLLPLGGIVVIGAVAFDQRRRLKATA